MHPPSPTVASLVPANAFELARMNGDAPRLTVFPFHLG
jgi:hypothetical protein